MYSKIRAEKASIIKSLILNNFFKFILYYHFLIFKSTKASFKSESKIATEYCLFIHFGTMGQISFKLYLCIQ